MQDSQTEQQEIADSIRLEASALPPHIEAKRRHLYKDILDSMISVYGEFIPQSTKEKSIQIIQRIIGIEDVPNFVKTFAPSATEERTSKLKGAFVRGPNFIVVSVDKVWDNLTEKEKAYFESRFSSAAPDVINVYSFLELGGHEIAHAMAAGDLPENFGEIGANYYGIQYVSKLFPSIDFLDDNTRAKIKLYQKVIDKYGVDVHKIFFGMEENKPLRAKILRELN